MTTKTNMNQKHQLDAVRLSAALDGDEIEYKRLPVEVLSSVTGHLFVKQPIEFRDTERTIDEKSIASNESIEICRLLGKYESNWQEPRVVIYGKAIEQASTLLPCAARDLDLIVRLHEFAHALFHLGGDPHHPALATVSESERQATLLVIAAISPYHSYPDDLHEPLAQLITYAAIAELANSFPGTFAQERMLAVQQAFFTLMKRQPQAYRIDDLLPCSPLAVARLIGDLKWGRISTERWRESFARIKS